MSPRTEIIENVIGVESLFSPSVNRCGRATRKSSVGSKQPYSLHSAAGRLERVSKIGPESPQDGEERSPAAAARRPFAARGGGMEEEGREGTFSLSRTPNQYRGCVRVCVCVGALGVVCLRVCRPPFQGHCVEGARPVKAGSAAACISQCSAPVPPVARSPAASPAPCKRSALAMLAAQCARAARVGHESLPALAVGCACVFEGHVRTKDARFFFLRNEK